MYGAVLALIIALMMICFVIYKSNFYSGKYFVCRKSEIEFLIDSLPDDCILEVWIGRSTYEQYGNRNSPRRDLRNHIPE